MDERATKRDLVLAPSEYAYMQDVTKGVIKTYTGPTVINPTAQERPVVFNATTKLFEPCSLEEAVQQIAIAPEGTRSPTPRLGRFKQGAFHMAMQGGAPIVPIVIRNAGEIIRKGSLVIRPGTIDVAVLPPIPAEDWTVEQLDARIAELRRLYLDTLESWPCGGRGGRGGCAPAHHRSP